MGASSHLPLAAPNHPDLAERIHLVGQHHHQHRDDNDEEERNQNNVDDEDQDYNGSYNNDDICKGVT